MAYTSTTQLITLSAGPAVNWTNTNVVLPEGMIGYESDTKKFKVGDGSTNWTSLAYCVDEALSDAQLAILEQASQANGACVLDENGLIPLDKIPEELTQHIRYVANIEARNAIPIADRHGIIVVLDASGDIVPIEDAIVHTIENVYDVAADGTLEGGVVLIDFGTLIGVTAEDYEGHQTGDISVKAGGAVYVWNGSTTDGAWFKISEFESLDIDFSIYFNTLLDTLDNIAEGTQYIHFTPSDKTIIEITHINDETKHINTFSPSELLVRLA